MLAVPAAEKQTVFTIPIDSAERRCVPQGKLRVARSRNGGKTWKLPGKGLPESHAHVLVLREAMTSDDRDPAGVFFGTSTASLFYTRDAGDSWHVLAEHLPRRTTRSPQPYGDPTYACGRHCPLDLASPQGSRST